MHSFRQNLACLPRLSGLVRFLRRYALLIHFTVLCVALPGWVAFNFSFDSAARTHDWAWHSSQWLLNDPHPVHWEQVSLVLKDTLAGGLAITLVFGSSMIPLAILLAAPFSCEPRMVGVALGMLEMLNAYGILSQFAVGMVYFGGPLILAIMWSTT